MPLSYRRRRAPRRVYRRRRRGGEIIPRSIASRPRPRVVAPSTWDRFKNFLKKHQIVSRGLSAVSGMLPERYSPYASMASSLASRYGYGRRRRVGRPRHVGRPRRVGRRPVRHRRVGRPRLRASGRRHRVYHRRPVRRMHRRRGRGFFGDIGSFFTRTLPSAVRSGASFVGSQLRKPSTMLGLAGMIPGQLSMPFKVGSAISGLLGHGRRRRHIRARCGYGRRRKPVRRVRRFGGRSTFVSQIQPMSFL